MNPSRRSAVLPSGQIRHKPSQLLAFAAFLFVVVIATAGCSEVLLPDPATPEPASASVSVLNAPSSAEHIDCPFGWPPPRELDYTEPGYEEFYTDVHDCISIDEQNRVLVNNSVAVLTVVGAGVFKPASDQPLEAVAFHSDFSSVTDEQFLLPGEAMSQVPASDIAMHPDLRLTVAWTTYRMAAQKAEAEGVSALTKALAPLGTVRRAVFDCGLAGYHAADSIRSLNGEQATAEQVLAALRATGSGGTCASSWREAEKGELARSGQPMKALPWAEEVATLSTETSKTIKLGQNIDEARTLICAIVRC